MTLYSCLSCFIAPLTLLLEYDDPTTNGNNSLKDLWNLGFGSINGLYLLLKLSGKSLTANVLTANSPQLLLSFTYFIYNGVVTQMLLSWEYMQFSTHRKVLRVSAPIGAQRSSYWLQLPYSYAIPLMVAMALLHWLVSQSIFLARINVLEYDGTIDIYQSIDGCGWSPIAIVFALFVGGIMVLALPVLGAQRYPNTMPFAGSNTAAISAACHRGDNEDATISRQPLKYGVLMCLGPEGRRRVGFSADEVEPLVEGEHYE